MCNTWHKALCGSTGQEAVAFSRLAPAGLCPSDFGALDLDTVLHSGVGSHESRIPPSSCCSGCFLMQPKTCLAFWAEVHSMSLTKMLSPNIWCSPEELHSSLVSTWMLNQLSQHFECGQPASSISTRWIISHIHVSPLQKQGHHARQCQVLCTNPAR